MARKGILTPSTSPADGKQRPKARMMPHGAVGALQSSLSRLQESAVQEIDPALIDDAGVVDRLGSDAEADLMLRDSLKTYGQQVPALVRPHPTRHGRYEIVYGRRRVLALKALGLPVKAMVRHLNDQALVMAQGQENTARQDLSFIEKANFAAQLDATGYDRQTICAALSIDLPMVSRMLKVGKAFDLDFLRHIGSAPSIGRERWLALADAMQRTGAAERIADVLPGLADIDSSDARFEKVLAAASDTPKKTPPKSTARVVHDATGTPFADVKRSARGLTLTISARHSEGFDSWIDTHAETLLQELHDRWNHERSEDTP